MLNTQISMLSIANTESPTGTDNDDVFLHTFPSVSPGVYRACFHNDVSKWSSKTVALDLRPGKEEDVETVEGRGKHIPVPIDHDSTIVHPETATTGDVMENQKIIRMISNQLDTIDSRQTHAEHRLSIHTTTNLESHSRLTLGSIFETCVYVVCCVGQVGIIKGWFKGRTLLPSQGRGYGGGKWA